uniref:Uncharacterized protein n=1 Tax=Arundo donax TaxID=35708 RepID=A0A0A9EBS8_ARUDO
MKMLVLVSHQPSTCFLLHSYSFAILSCQKKSWTCTSGLL